MQGMVFKDLPVPSDYEDDQGSDLSAIFDLQRDLMGACGLHNLPRDFALLLTAQNLSQEVSEAVRPLGAASKPWLLSQEGEFPPLPLADMKEEWIDILFFWVQGAIQMGMTAEDVRTAYIAKNLRNFERIKEKGAAK